ncbi:hypothetical protein Tco_1498891, partial [Tanacetum coccineum]
SHDESFRVDDLDLTIDLNVSQTETQVEVHVSEVFVSKEADVRRTEVLVFEEAGVGRTEEHIVERVIVEEVVNGSFEEDVEHGIDSAYETQYHVESSEDSEDDDEDDDDDFLVDEENEIVEPDVDVHLFGTRKDVHFDNIGVANLVPNDVLKGEAIDIVNLDGYDSDTEAKDRVYIHSNKSRRMLKLYKNDNIRVRARCEEKVHLFTMSQGTGPTNPNHGMGVGPSGSSGPSTMNKKRKNTGTNDDNQTCFSALDAHDKGDLCYWVLFNLEIPVKAVQDQLQRDLELQVSMSKAFRAKAKAEREVKGDHVLKYVMLRDYVVELQSTNPIQLSRLQLKGIMILLCL